VGCIQPVSFYAANPSNWNTIPPFNTAKICGLSSYTAIMTTPLSSLAPNEVPFYNAAQQYITAVLNAALTGAPGPNCDLNALLTAIQSGCGTLVLPAGADALVSCVSIYNNGTMVGVPGYLGLCATPTPTALPSPTRSSSALPLATPTRTPTLASGCVRPVDYYAATPIIWNTIPPFNTGKICVLQYTMIMTTPLSSLSASSARWYNAAQQYIAALLNQALSGAPGPNCDLSALLAALQSDCINGILPASADAIVTCVTTYNNGQMVGVPGYLGLCTTPIPTPFATPSRKPACVNSFNYWVSNINIFSGTYPFSDPNLDVICGYNHIELMDTQFITPQNQNWRFGAHEYIAALINMIYQGAPAPNCDMEALRAELQATCSTKVISAAAVAITNCLYTYNTGAATGLPGYTGACSRFTPLPGITQRPPLCPIGASSCGTGCCTSTCCGDPLNPSTQQCCTGNTFCCNSQCVNGTSGVEACCDDPLGGAFSCSQGSTCCGFNCCPSGTFCGGPGANQQCCPKPWCGSQCCGAGTTCSAGNCVTSFSVGGSSDRSATPVGGSGNSSSVPTSIIGVVAAVVGVAVISVVGFLVVRRNRASRSRSGVSDNNRTTTAEVYL